MPSSAKVKEGETNSLKQQTRRYLHASKTRYAENPVGTGAFVSRHSDNDSVGQPCEQYAVRRKLTFAV